MRLLTWRQLVQVGRYVVRGNRHCVRRWALAARPVLLVAGDLVEEDRRGEAAALLCEIMPLVDALAAIDRLVVEPQPDLSTFFNNTSAGSIWSDRSTDDILADLGRLRQEIAGSLGMPASMLRPQAYRALTTQRLIRDEISRQLPPGAEITDLQYGLAVHDQIEVRYRAIMPQAIHAITITWTVDV